MFPGAVPFAVPWRPKVFAVLCGDVAVVGLPFRGDATGFAMDGKQWVLPWMAM
jgi:hypothetical protein